MDSLERSQRTGRILVAFTAACLCIGGCSGDARWLQGIQLGSASPPAHWTAQLARIPDLNSGQDAAVHVLQVERPVFVIFYSPSCEPCRKLAPSVASLHGKYASRVDFYKVEAPAGRDLRDRWQVQGDPTVLVFRKGAVSDHILGWYEMERYEEAIDCALSGTAGTCSGSSPQQCGPGGCGDIQPTGPSAF